MDIDTYEIRKKEYMNCALSLEMYLEIPRQLNVRHWRKEKDIIYRETLNNCGSRSLLHSIVLPSCPLLSNTYGLLIQRYYDVRIVFFW